MGEPDLVDHINKSAAVVAFTTKETIAVDSSMEVELCAIGRAIKLAEWVAHFREESDYAQTQPATILTDSAVAIKFLTDSGSVPNRQTRHLRRRVLCIKQALARNIAVLKFVPGNLNCADLLTKPLGRVLFERHSKNMMGELYNG